MTDGGLVAGAEDPGARWSSPAMRGRLARRHAFERRFRRAGLAAVGLAIASLGLLLASIAWNGASAFRATELRLDVSFDPAALGVQDLSGEARAAVLASADYRRLIPLSLPA